MIKIFRKIRQGLLTENKFSKYLLYAIGEVMLVVIGILIALQINNWNQLRLEKVEEKNILRNLTSEFEGNLQEIKSTNEFREAILKTTEVLFKSIDKLDYKNTSLIDSLMRICFINPSFDPQQGSLNSLIYSGRLGIISNDSLRALLISWPGLVDDLKEEESLIRTQAFSINTSYFEKLASMRNITYSKVGPMQKPNKRSQELQEASNSLPSISKSPRASDYKNLFQDKTLENRLSNRFRTIRRSLVEGLVVQKRTETILELLSMELKNNH